MTAMLSFSAVGLVLAQILTPQEPGASSFVPLAVATLCVFAGIFSVSLLVEKCDLSTPSAVPWFVGALSVTFAVTPIAILVWGDGQAAALIYQGLRVPQGIERFWDLSLILRSIDCSSWGFDVYAPNNGCLKDPTIYGPGMLWLGAVPFIAFKNVLWLGAALAAASSLALVWLARASAGTGQVVLLVAAVGTPWMLLLERGNIDAVVFVSVVLGVACVRRAPSSLMAWSIAAALAWLMGTWKYYPFAMGLLLLPVLAIKRGWIVLGAYAVASLAYVAMTWDNFRFSLSANSAMTEIGDLVVLGRTPIVARFVGATFPSVGLQWGDLLVLLLAVSAAVWGGFVALQVRGYRRTGTLLALAGAPIYLASVLVGGFGWGYKTAFLLLCVPLLSFATSPPRPVLSGTLMALILIAVAAVTSANALLASLAGIVAATFALGMALVLAMRAIRRGMHHDTRREYVAA